MGVPTAVEVAYMKAHASDDRSMPLLLGSIIPLVFASVAFVLRFVSRHVGGVKLGLEDWLIMVGMFLTVAAVISLGVTMHYGLGRHIIYVKDRKGFAISCLIRYVLYPSSVCFIKLSILAFYCRLFPMPWLRRISIALGAFVVLATLTKVTGDIFQCLPVDSAWNPTPHKRCMNFVDLVIVSGVLNIATDLVILVLPMPALWGLNMARVKKWELTGMFLTGGLVCIISIVRLPIVQKLRSNDPSWDLFGPLTISEVESCAAIVAACIPTYRPLFNLIVHGDARKDVQRKCGPGSRFSAATQSSESESSTELTMNNNVMYAGENIKGEQARSMDIHVSRSFAIESSCTIERHPEHATSNIV